MKFGPPAFCMLVALLSSSPKVHSQAGDSLSAPVDTGAIFSYVTQMPAYPGGEQKRSEFIAENIKYPRHAQTAGVQGKVYVSFVVDKSGAIRNARVERGIGGGCDEEALRVVNLMPKWEPGMQSGEAVNVKLFLPVVFRIERIEQNEYGQSPPVFPGGIGEFFKYIQKEMVPPESVKRKNIDGNVYISFAIDSTGSVINAIVLESLNEECDREALRLVNTSPKWIPGMQNGKKVIVRLSLPIRFKSNS